MPIAFTACFYYIRRKKWLGKLKRICRIDTCVIFLFASVRNMKTFAIVLFLVLGTLSFSNADIPEKTYLVSMRKAEFLSIVECISISRDPALCAKFAQCEKTMPYRVFAAMQKCQKEHVGNQVLRCTKHEPLYKTPVIPAKIFECVVETVKKLTPPEKEVMIKFEACAKKLQEESCKIVDSHIHRHSHLHRMFPHLP